MRLPPLNALRAFEAAARHGSFTRAGRELHVTHGAISQQVKLLEESLGASLFTRKGNRITLTPCGGAIYEIAHRGLKSFEEIPQLACRPQAITGDVTISAPRGFTNYWLAHRMTEFHRNFPDLKLHVVPSNADAEIWSDQVDICIRYGDGAWPRRRVILLADIYLFPICSPGLLRRAARLDRPADLTGFPILCADDGEEWNAWLGSVGMVDDLAANRHYFGDSLSATEACQAGFGVALGGNISAKRYLEQGLLVRPFSHSVRMARSLFIITRNRAEAHPAIDATHRWFLDQFHTAVE